MLKIKYREINKRKWWEDNIIKLINEAIIQSLPWKHWPNSIKVLNNNIDDIFVETKKNQYRITSICLSAMYKHQWFQKFKLAYCIICTACSLLAFLSKNTNTNMRLQYHIYVVSSISDGQGYFFRKTSTYHVHNVCFLLGRNPACKNYVNEVWGLEELVF